MADVFKVAAKAITTTNAFQVLVVGSSATAIVRSLTICNTSTASTASCDVLASNLSGDVYVFRLTSFTAAQTIDPLQNAIVLGPSESLKVQASPANAIHVRVSYLESE